jgi:amidophosphoribosyltransferase
MPRLEGAFSTVVMTKDSVVGFRDPAAAAAVARPARRALLRGLGELRVRHHRGELLREVQPGEMISLSERGIETRQLVESPRRRSASSSTSTSRARLDPRGQPHQVSRRKMGEILWRESPVEATW